MSTSSPGTGNLDLKKRVNDLEKNEKHFIEVRTTVTRVASIAPNEARYINVDIPVLDGYEPVIGFYRTNTVSSEIIPYILSTVPQGSILQFGIRNFGTNTYTNFEINAYVVYQKENE